MLLSKQHISDYCYGIVSSASSAAVWKEHLFRTVATGDSDFQRGVVPPWASIVASYAPRLSRVILDYPKLVLCILDSITSVWIFSLGRKRDTMTGADWARLAAHAVNPVHCVASMLEGAACVEQLFLLLVLQLVSYHAPQSTTKRLITFVIFVSALCLVGLHGLEWVGMSIVALWITFASTRTFAVYVGSWGLAICVCCGAIMMAATHNEDFDGVYFHRNIQSFDPDIGPGWYIWQLIPSAFEAPYRIVMHFMPIVVSIPVALHASRKNSEAGQVTLSGLRDRQCVVVWAILSTFICRRSFSLGDLFFGFELVVGVDHTVFDRMQGLFLPVVGTMMLIPLQQAFFRAWVVTRVMNANWLFFSCVFQMAAFVLFALSYLEAFLGLE